MLKGLTTIIFTLLVSLVSAKVEEFTAKDLENAVGGKKALFIEFYTPWCSHCKELTPTYTRLGESYEHIENDITIARINVDKYKSIEKKFEIKKYPTMKLYLANEKEPIECNSQVSLEDLMGFIEEKSGIRGKPRPFNSKVVVLDESNFDEIVGNPENNVMVEFYAPWCNHCKALAPTYEKVAKDFENEENVIIAKVDAIANDSLNTRYRVGGYPTVYFFQAHKRNENPISFERGRDEFSFVSFLNEHCGTNRLVGGGLNNKAGRNIELDKLIRKYLFTDHPVEKQDLMNFVRRMSETKDSTRYTKFYYKMLQKVTEDPTVISKEIDRINSVVAKGKLNSKKLDDFKMRLNILESFKSSLNDANDDTVSSHDDPKDDNKATRDEL